MDKVFYEYLNNNDKELVDQIDNHEILGASKQIELISGIMLRLVQENMHLETSKLINIINNCKNYFIETRGNASRAFVNSLKELTPKLLHEIDNNNQLLHLFEESITIFKDNANKNLERILEFANNELSVYDDIFLYDYSSTVEKTIKFLCNNNDKRYNIYIAESAAIDGGKPYLNLTKEDNLNVYFFPDASIQYFLEKADCCLMGAETFYSNGTGFNTIGSEIIGSLSNLLNKKLYFITPMNKLDERRDIGIRKEIVYIEYKNKDLEPFEEKVDSIIPELVGVKPENIHAYITEYGVIPTNNLYLVSKQYLENIGE